MAQIDKRGLESNSVDGSKVKFLNNESFRARNFADTADANLFKLNASDEFELQILPKFGISNVALESYVDDALSGLTGAFVFKGNWDASTNTPSLADGVGTVGWLYRASVAGTVDFGSGNITFAIGDKVAYDGAIWEKWDVIDNEFATSNTDDLTEGSTNLYHTTARARTAAVVNSTAGNETDQAASVAAMKTFVNAQSANVDVESFTLDGTDITNGYIDLAVEADKVITVDPKGFPSQYPVDDYTLSVVSLKTRITFAGDMLSLIAGDKIKVAYSI